uniref:Uncharacterized protein n=1 Tax=Anguilla anguilla TaxID=7936 RepID=A0A0E9V3M3_ANGAN
MGKIMLSKNVRQRPPKCCNCRGDRAAAFRGCEHFCPSQASPECERAAQSFVCRGS